MIVKAIYKDKEHDYFRDKTTAPEIENQVKRVYGDIFECDDELAKERIKGGFVKEASKKEQKEYLDSIDTNDEKDLEKSLEELSIEELVELAKTENIELVYPKDDTAKSIIVETIKKIREERNKDGEK